MGFSDHLDALFSQVPIWDEDTSVTFLKLGC
jgi:hypothetical protein